AAFAVGLHWGIVGVAVGYAVSSTIIEPFFTYVTARALGIPVLSFVSGLAGVVQATGVMLGSILAVRFLVGNDLPPLLRLLLIALTGAAVYIPLCLWRVPELRLETQQLKRFRQTSEQNVAGEQNAPALSSGPAV